MPTLDATRSHVEAWTRHLEDQGYALSTIAQRLSTLSSFYRWCVIEQHRDHNPVDAIRRPRRSTESTTQALSRHELTEWLDAAEQRGGYTYTAACLLAMNGLRVGELCAADVTDLDEQTWHRVLWLRAPDAPERVQVHFRPPRDSRSADRP